MSDQGEDWVWYPDGSAYEAYSPNQGVRFVEQQEWAVDPYHLPPCQVCGKEVKPGEDLCWECLGESFPVDDTEGWYVYGQENLVSQVIYNTYPVAVGTSIPTTLFFTTTSTLDVTGVSNVINNVAYTFSPPISLVSGDTIQIKLGVQ